MRSLKDYIPGYQPPKKPTKSTSKRLSENVMGGITSVNPLGRMLVLAGVTAADINQSSSVLMEADAASTVTQLIATAINLPQFKGNEEAAKLYAVGSILSALAKNMEQTSMQTTAGQAKSQELKSLGAMGADLITTATGMATSAVAGKPTTPGSPPSPTLPAAQTTPTP